MKVGAQITFSFYTAKEPSWGRPQVRWTIKFSLPVCTCMYTCVHVHLCVHVYLCAYACICVYMHVHLCACVSTPVCACIPVCACTLVCVHVHVYYVYARTPLCMHVNLFCEHTPVCIHLCLHVHLCVCTCILVYMHAVEIRDRLWVSFFSCHPSCFFDIGSLVAWNSPIRLTWLAVEP